MLNAARYIYFTNNMKGMSAFYRDVLGMTVKPAKDSMGYDEADFIQLMAGSFEIALHKAGKPGLDGRNRNKLVFYCEDVAAERERLIAKGVKFGKFEPKPGQKLVLADFKDPDGNTLQLSNR
jgi:catechol 2,3-dioxygenase-like lactoylglutathione lyase family enzyme